MSRVLKIGKSNKNYAKSTKKNVKLDETKGLKKISLAICTKPHKAGAFVPRFFFIPGSEYIRKSAFTVEFNKSSAIIGRDVKMQQT